jgi:hypothetical protein
VANKPLEENRNYRQKRRRFLAQLWYELRVIWPIVSGLIGVQLMLGALVSFLERWPIVDAVYFTFVTGLTIGYGDLVPSRFLSRVIAMLIGLTGILFAGLVAAVGVRALQAATAEPGEWPTTSRPRGQGSARRPEAQHRSDILSVAGEAGGQAVLGECRRGGCHGSNDSRRNGGGVAAGVAIGVMIGAR